jgi:hypothetical protein
MNSQRVQEIHQILFLLIAEPDVETLIIEIHRIDESCGPNLDEPNITA